MWVLGGGACFEQVGFLEFAPLGGWSFYGLYVELGLLVHEVSLAVEGLSISRPVWASKSRTTKQSIRLSLAPEYPSAQGVAAGVVIRSIPCPLSRGHQQSTMKSRAPGYSRLRI